MVRLSTRVYGKGANNIQIIGMNQVEDVLHKLPDRISQNVLRQTARAAGKYIWQAAKWNVSKWSKTIMKQVKIWNMKKQPRTSGGVYVGWKIPRSVEGKRAQRAWQARGGLWLEYGTSGKTRTGNRNVRKIQPTGWFRRAVDTKIGQTERDYKKILGIKINKFLDKYITKHGW